MSNVLEKIVQLLEEDPRYKLEAYRFVREALSYAHDVMKLGRPAPSGEEGASKECHLTGQQLCEASRRYALDQYGMIAPLVLRNWGIQSTSDLGEIVYNMIRIDLMRKSPSDRREDFNDVFDFDRAFNEPFTVTAPESLS